MSKSQAESHDQAEGYHEAVEATAKENITASESTLRMFSREGIEPGMPNQAAKLLSEEQAIEAITTDADFLAELYSIADNGVVSQGNARRVALSCLAATAKAVRKEQDRINAAKATQ